MKSFQLEVSYIGIIIYLNNCLFTNWCDPFHKQQHICLTPIQSSEGQTLKSDKNIDLNRMIVN